MYGKESIGMEDVVAAISNELQKKPDDSDSDHWSWSI